MTPDRKPMFPLPETQISAGLAVLLGGALWLLAGCAPPQDDAVLALVNGRTITQVEFDIRWNELSEATRARYSKEGGKRRFLDELITRELLMQEARRQGLDQNDVIRDRTQRYKEQLILDELLKERLREKVDLTPAELAAYYDKHANELLAPLKVQVSQMLLPNLPAAKDLKKQIETGGDFAKFAQRYSLDEKTKAKGGDLGPYRKSALDPEVDAVVHTLKPGVISEPIKTEAGYYLIKVSPLDQATIQADFATRERLRQELLADKRRKRFEDVISDIRTKATVRLAEGSRYIAEDTGTP
ncbi:MAG: peptidylprolyl isomerase [Nitrospira sp.]|nr:peptidylprolyl isomerase [Nitrospira sp.]